MMYLLKIINRFQPGMVSQVLAIQLNSINSIGYQEPVWFNGGLSSPDTETQL